MADKVITLAGKPRKTTLYDQHRLCGAKIVDFHGWLMPVEYTGILEEAKAVRSTCGLFDISHMGTIEVRGAEACRYLQYILSNDIAQIEDGQVQYNLFCDADGGIIDDLMVTRVSDKFFCVVNASNSKEDFSWMLKNKTGFDVEIIDQSQKRSFLALQGPLAEVILKQSLNIDVHGLPYMHAMECSWQGAKIFLSRTGYTGEDGFEFFVDHASAQKIWEILLSFQRRSELKLCGLGARDILRLEMGYTLYGNEISLSTNPFEAGLGWAVAMKKGAFIGQGALSCILKKGLSRKRIGFFMEERGMPRQGYPFVSDSGLAIGTVTSGGFSPNLNNFIGMGYIANEHLQNNQEIFVSIRQKNHQIKIRQLPFWAARTRHHG